MALLSKEQIIKCKDLKTEEVSVPEWGGEVLVQELNGTDRLEIYSICFKDDKKVDLPLLQKELASRSIVDKEGKRLFVSSEDIEKLIAKSGAALERIYQVALKLSGLSTEKMEEAAKNSETTQN
ncbi:MAG: hypothetical protein ACTSYH_03560 [Candidatus Heimdallarchaeaceae archaeon]